MVREKRDKAKIKRRSPGLVITPPAPRPVDADHPARLLFREAIESAKASTEVTLVENNKTAEEASPPVEIILTPPSTSLTSTDHSAPLQIFKELKDAASRQEAPPAATLKHSVSTSLLSFEEYFGPWKSFLSTAQICVLQALFNLTYVLGSDECFTSMPRLAAAAGVSERQTYNVVKELEKLGFIERTEIFNTPTKKGTVFRLYLTRHEAGATKRQYRLED